MPRAIHDMSDENFEQVNRAYMELDNLDEQAFCRFYTEDLPTLMGMLADAIRRNQRKCQSYLDCLEAVTPRLLESYYKDTRKPLEDVLGGIEYVIGERRFILCKARYSSLFTDEELNYLQSELR